MMLYPVNAREFRQISLAKENVINARSGYSTPLLAAISTKWIALLPATSTLILIWLMGRTIAFGRAAAQIPYREFIEQSAMDGDEINFAPLPISMDTLQKHLKLLCERDLLDVYSIRSIEKGTESQARMFEINVKNIMDVAELEEATRGLLAEVEGKIIEEEAAKARKTGSTPPNRSGGSSYLIHTLPSVVSIQDKEISAGFAAPRDAGVGTDQRGVEMLAVPKKARPTRAYEQTCDEVLRKTVQASEVRRVARVAEVEAGQMSVKALQAVLDVCMGKYLPNLPRLIVTAKPYSVFCKRVKAANLDAALLSDFVIRQWTTIASQSRGSFAKDPSKHRGGSPIPPAPNFTEMAYRLPYFIACYANFMTTGGRTSAAADPKDAIIAQLQAKLMRAEQRQSHTIMRRRPVATPRAATATNLGDNWIPPSWEEFEQGAA